MTLRTRRWHLAPRTQAVLGFGLLLLAVWPLLRSWMEASMWRHMLLQFPWWMLAGGLLVAVLPEPVRAAVARWNAHGVAGLVLVALVLAVLMVPRVLDLALTTPRIEWAKCTALVVAGAALRLSWRAAGLVLQGFFLGNVLPMMVVVGQMYVDSPLRLCNAYLQDDQIRLGNWLVGVAAAVAMLWLAYVALLLIRRDGQTLEGA